MKKLALLPLLLLVACLVAGLYGAVHDQVSFTVSPDYFYAFKFQQFDVPEHLQGRAGAAIVGWQASWWMGVVIGIPVLAVGLIMPDARTYVTQCLVAFAVVALTTLAVGLGALAYAYATISAAALPDYWYPEGVVDRVAFARAGTMHNFSYLGGGIGILTGSAYLIAARVWMAERPISIRPTPYRIVVLVIGLLGAGVSIDAYITATINRFYFQTHHAGTKFLIWSGLLLAVVCVVEAVFLVVYRKCARTRCNSSQPIDA